MYRHIGHVCVTFIVFTHPIMIKERIRKPTGKMNAIKMGLPITAMSTTATIKAKKKIGNLRLD